MMHLLEAVPFTVFLVYLRSMDTGVPENFKAPFLAAGILGVCVTAFMLYRRQVLNRILLGINLFFMSGALAFVTGQFWLNTLYGEMRASGMLAWVAVTGLVSMMLGTRGFIGISILESPLARSHSVYLFLVSLAAFALSFLFRQNPLFSEVIPFTALFIAYGVFRRRCLGSEDTRDRTC